jgi:sporulation protein YlmC with PRC-barrel domain
MAEVRLDQLLGRTVIAQSGRAVGRIEEVIAVEESDGCYIDEFHMGRYALAERMAAWRITRSIARVIGHGKSYRVPWNKLELSDPKRPKLLCPVDELVELEAD